MDQSYALWHQAPTLAERSGHPTEGGCFSHLTATPMAARTRSAQTSSTRMELGDAGYQAGGGMAWSPTGDRISYNCPYSSTYTPISKICLADSEGNNPIE